MQSREYEVAGIAPVLKKQSSIIEMEDQCSIRLQRSKSCRKMVQSIPGLVIPSQDTSIAGRRSTISGKIMFDFARPFWSIHAPVV
jgi:hypothetical protein